MDSFVTKLLIVDVYRGSDNVSEYQSESERFLYSRYFLLYMIMVFK